LIKGKYAFVDLWAPWCGSCIAGCKAAIPVYEEFHDNGFTVVAVAGQFKKIEAIKKRLEQDKYPWLTLVEYESDHSIWDTYGVKWSGGITFLVDPNGKIVLMDPTPKQLRRVLNDALSKPTEAVGSL
jgi:thiol-disulfide isomerase/thioredoxin